MKKLLTIVIFCLPLVSFGQTTCNSGEVLLTSTCRIDFKVTMEELNKSIVILQDNVDQGASKESICSAIDDMRLRAKAVRDIFLEEQGSCYDAVRVEEDVLYKAKFNTVLSRTSDMRGFCGGLFGSLTRVEEGSVQGLNSAIRFYQRTLSNLKSYVANNGQNESQAPVSE